MSYKAKYDEDAKKYEYLLSKEQITEEFNRVVKDYQLYRSISETKKDILKLTKLQYHKQQINLQYGRSNLIEFYQANIKFNEAQFAQLAAEINLLTAYYKLQILIGQIEI